MRNQCEIRVFNRAIPHLRKCQAFAIVTIVLVIFLQGLMARPVLNWMLIQSVRAPSANWANFVLREVSSSKDLEFSNESKGAEASRGRERIAGIFGAALNTGSIHQIDIIRSDCMCAVSLGQGLAEFANVGDANPDRAPVSAALQQLFTGGISNSTVMGFGQNLLQIDYDALGHALEDGHSHISLINDDGGSPLYSAAIFQRSDGGTTFAVRLVMNLAGIAATQKFLLALASILLTVTSAIIVGLSARAIYTSRQAEADSDEQARFLVERDAMTGLYNRNGFKLHAQAFLAGCAARGKRACLLQYDVDMLKEINDLHGHPAGDAVIRSVAEMIKKVFPDGTLAARLDGDEFAVLVEEDTFDEDKFGALPTLIDVPTEATRELAVSTSVGFAFFPDDGKTLAGLMKATDLALDNVKKTASRGVGAYSLQMAEAFEERAWQISNIREAALRGEIQPYYQPLMNARTHELEGVEALVRWKHPELGVLPPNRFEHALDDPAAAISITTAMMQQVVRDLLRWHRAGHEFYAGLNIGETDLRNPEFLPTLDAAMQESDLPRRALAIEVTERAVNTETLEEFLPVLDALRERDMFVSLDDFGTGTSSITLLRALPCTSIKIDKSFVDHMTRDQDDRSIVRALTNLGHDLKIKVVAEGVEEKEQSDMLTAMGVDLLQGYYFSCPVSASEVDDLLNQVPVSKTATHAEPSVRDNSIISIHRMRSMQRNNHSRTVSRMT